jgi:hypothetical protein
VHQALKPHLNGDSKKVVFYGSGEEAELAYIVLRELGLKLEAIIDPERIGHKCLGYDVKDHSWFDDRESVNILLMLHPMNGNGESQTVPKAIKKSNCKIEHLVYVNI